MSKFTTICIVLCALLVQPSRAIYVKNEFGKKIIFWTSQRIGAGNSPLYFGDGINNLAYFHIEPESTKDVGNDRIDALVVASGNLYWSGIVKDIDDIYKGFSSAAYPYNITQCGTALREADLKPYRDALTKLPGAIIRIIPDPKMPTRPLAILPEKELKEFLVKEHRAKKVKPLIQERGKLPDGVADICAEYWTPEE